MRLLSFFIIKLILSKKLLKYSKNHLTFMIFNINKRENGRRIPTILVNIVGILYKIRGILYKIPLKNDIISIVRYLIDKFNILNECLVCNFYKRLHFVQIIVISTFI